MNSTWTPNLKKPPIHPNDVVPEGLVQTDIFVIVREGIHDFVADISPSGEVTWSQDPSQMLRYNSLDHATSDAKCLDLEEGCIAVCEVHLDPDGNAPAEKFIGGVGFRPFFRFSFDEDSQ